MILSAMKRWEVKTCIKFVPWTDELKREFGEIRYINFFSGGSCFSKHGRHKNQPQLIGIGSGCRQVQIIVHELGHAIGLVHEMERNDRDYYIEVNYDNLNPDSALNYDTTDAKKTVFPYHNTPYDYKSIMHYGPKAWSANGKNVITTKDPAYQAVIGKARDLSFFDALYVNRAYNCSAKCSTSLSGLCRNGGFLGGPDCRCICHDGYAGEFCDQPLPGYDKIVDWNCQKNWDFHSGKCYNFKTDELAKYTSASNYCSRQNSTLVTFKTRPEMEWLSQMTKEKKSISLKKSFWVGISRSILTNNDLKWADGTLVDTNLISLVDNSVADEDACAQFDGESVKLTNCDADNENGFICGKVFDTACGGRYMVTESAITINSPGFPYAYPSDIECQYVFQTNANSRISIKFDLFILDSNCNRDYLEVQLSSDVNKPGTRYCGKDLRGKNLTSDGALAILSFKTDTSIASMGFKASVKEVPNYSWTTSSPFSFIDALKKVFMKAENIDNDEETSAWSLSSLMDIVNAMAFSKTA